MPPYVITEDEMRLMAEVATEGIERAPAQYNSRGHKSPP
jgi:adenosylmethionine-8-amino-7-oxononanoate aminotransferase